MFLQGNFCEILFHKSLDYSQCIYSTYMSDKCIVQTAYLLYVTRMLFTYTGPAFSLTKIQCSQCTVSFDRLPLKQYFHHILLKFKMLC